MAGDKATLKKSSTMDVQKLPKLELHAHLSGSISRPCLHDIWARKKALGETELDDPLVVMPVGKFDYDLDTFFPLFSKYIYHLCNDIDSIVLTTNSVLQDFEQDGVVYLELRTTPRAIPSAGLDKEAYVTTILGCIRDFNKKSHTTTASLILSIDRRNDLETAMDVVKLASIYRDRGVVGIDLCGDPSQGAVSSFTPAFKLANEREIPVTIHFAEVSTVTREELLTILSWKPNRLGHVIHVPSDIKNEILKQEIGLELCLSCNVHAKMFEGTFSDHHFGEWRERGGLIALSTDDVGVFGSPLSNEYALVAQHFGLQDEELKSLARGAIEIIFGGEEEKARLRALMSKQ